MMQCCLPHATRRHQILKDLHPRRLHASIRILFRASSKPGIAGEPGRIGRVEKDYSAIRELRQQPARPRLLHGRTPLAPPGLLWRHIRRAMRHDAAHEGIVVEPLRYAEESEPDGAVPSTARVAAEPIRCLGEIQAE